MRALSLALLLAAASASAQPANWLPLPTDEASVSLVASKPFIGGDSEAFYSSAWYLSTVQPVRDRIRIVGDVPFALAGGEFFVTDVQGVEVARESQSAVVLGNLGVGAEVDTPSGLALGVGVRLPTATEPSFAQEDAAESLALAIGSFSETGRYGAFFPNTATVYGMATFKGYTSGPVAVRAHLVPFALFSTAEGRDTEGYVSYAAQALYTTGPARLGGGLVGTTRTSTRGVGDGFDERSEIALGVLAEAEVGAVRPSLVVHKPVFGFFDDSVDLVVGLGVTVSFE